MYQWESDAACPQERLGIYSLERGHFEKSRVSDQETCLNVLASSAFLKGRDLRGTGQDTSAEITGNLAALGGSFLHFRSDLERLDSMNNYS